MTVGTRIIPFEVPDFDQAGLSSSSVVVFTNTKRVTKPAGTPGNSFQFGDLQFTVKPVDSRTYRKSDTFRVWFFVYGFGLDESGQASLTEECVFLQEGFRHAATKAKPLRIEGDRGFVDTGIPLTSFSPGKYRAQFTITDKVNEETLTKEEEFTVVE